MPHLGMGECAKWGTPRVRSAESWPRIFLKTRIYVEGYPLIPAICCSPHPVVDGKPAMQSILKYYGSGGGLQIIAYFHRTPGSPRICASLQVAATAVVKRPKFARC